jgi:hypothetical protein
VNMQPDKLQKYFDAARKVQPVTDANAVITQAIKKRSSFRVNRRLLLLGLTTGILLYLLIFRNSENFISTTPPEVSSDVKSFEGTPEPSVTHSSNTSFSAFAHKSGNIASPFLKETIPVSNPHYSESNTVLHFNLNKNSLTETSFTNRIIYIDKEEAEILGFTHPKTGQTEFTCLSSRSNDTTCISYLTTMVGDRRIKNGYSYQRMNIEKPLLKSVGIFSTLHDTSVIIHMYDNDILPELYRNFFHEAYDYLIWVRYAPNPGKPERYIELALEPDANIAQYFKGVNAAYIAERSSIWHERDEKIILTRIIEKYIAKSKTINPPFELTQDLHSRMMSKFVFADEATLNAYGIKLTDDGYKYIAYYTHDKKTRVIRVKQKGLLLDIYKNKTLFWHKTIPYRNTLYAITDTRLSDFSFIQDHPSLYEINSKQDLLKRNLIDSLDHFNAIAIPFKYKYKYNNMEASDTSILWFRKTGN